MPPSLARLSLVVTDIHGLRALTSEVTPTWPCPAPEHGDEAAARLAARFATLVREDVAAQDGQVIKLRGDEVRAVVSSARQALRAATSGRAIWRIRQLAVRRALYLTAAAQEGRFPACVTHVTAPRPLFGVY
jgi:hypothetical protein